MRSWEKKNQSGSEKTLLLLCFYSVFELVADLLTLICDFLLLLLNKYKQVFCSSLKAWMSVITAFWKIVSKYTWTWYGNCLSAPCNQKNMLCLLIYQENFTYSVDSDQSESLISVSVYFGWSVHLLLALCIDADD